MPPPSRYPGNSISFLLNISQQDQSLTTLNEERYHQLNILKSYDRQTYNFIHCYPLKSSRPLLNVRSQIIHVCLVPIVKLFSFLLLLHCRGMWHICFLNTYFVTRFDFDFQVTDAGIGHLAKHCQKLNKLDLQGCNVSCDKYMYTTQ